MKEDIFSFYDNPIDSMLMTNEYDEWDHMRYHIFEELKACDVKDGVHPDDLPFFLWFRGKITNKLLRAGFKKEIIEDEKEFKKLIYIINFEQGRPFVNHSWDLNPPYGFPSGVYKISENKLLMWIHPDIEAALLALESLTTLKRLLVNSDIVLDKPVVNNEAVKVYLRALELIINLSRAGDVPKMAKAEAEKRSKSLRTRDLKKLVLQCIIDNIFKKNPHRPKTLGEVWNKIDGGHGCIRLTRNKKLYMAETGKADGKDVIIIKGYIEKAKKDANGKDLVNDVSEPFIYAKRSLQYFINEVKKNSIQTTQ